ncbi:MAG: hypothetical protein WD044_04930 [Dongiaceae bacterium]
MSVLPVQDEEDVRNDVVVSEDGFALLGSEAFDAILPLVLELPDGQFVTVEALIAAVTAGASAVQGEAGTEIPIEFVYELLTKELGKVGAEGEFGDEPLGGQASFRDGTTLEFLDALLLSGRIHSSDGQTPSLSEITRRSKSKEMSSDTLREILVDGPDAENDVITPAGRDGQVTTTEFGESTSEASWPSGFRKDIATGNLLKNDSFGEKSAPVITSMIYNGETFKAVDGVIVVEEKGVWRLTVNAGGTEAMPEKAFGSYTFEFIGPYDHSQSTDGYADFSLSYTILNRLGQTDTASIQFSIRDDKPVTQDDVASVMAGNNVTGLLFENDIIGGDGLGGVQKIGGGLFGSMTPADVDVDGKATIVGLYGDLLFDFDDGSFEYFARADALSAGEAEVTDIFNYTVFDGDGDVSSASLSIHVTPHEPTVKPTPPFSPPDDDEPVEGDFYTWSSIESIDADGDASVDLAEVIKGFDPAHDRLNIEGLLESLGYDDVAEASEVFRLANAPNGVDLQINLGFGWQTFVTVSDAIPLTTADIEPALIT